MLILSFFGKNKLYFAGLLIGLLLLVLVYLMIERGSDSNTPASYAFVQQSGEEIQEEVRESIKAQWNDAITIFELNRKDWMIYELDDMGNLDNNNLKHMSVQTLDAGEQSVDYVQRVSSGIQEAFVQHRKVGDSLPLLMLHKEHKVTKMLFRRDFGKGPFVEITLEPILEKRTPRILIDKDNSNMEEEVFGEYWRGSIKELNSQKL